MLDRAAAMRQQMLSVQEEAELLLKWRDHRDISARDRIVHTHMRICYGLAARWTQNEAHMNDLAQEGVFGLIHAMDKFDPSRGIRFGTYARWWVKTAIESELSKVVLSVDMPSRVYRRAKGAEPQAGNPDVVPWEARVVARGEVPLDAPMGDSGEDTLMDMLSDHRPNPEDTSIETDRIGSVKRAVEEALTCALTPREAAILRRRDLAERPETLEAIAASMNISRERVRQIQNSGLSKLKKHMISTKFPVHLLRSVV